MRAPLHPRRVRRQARRAQRARWDAGLLVYVPAGVQVELPIEAVTSATGASGRVFGRTLVVVEAGAKATVIDRYVSPDLSGTVQASTVTELFIAEGAELEHLAVIDWGAGCAPSRDHPRERRQRREGAIGGRHARRRHRARSSRCCGASAAAPTRERSACSSPPVTSISSTASSRATRRPTPTRTCSTRARSRTTPTRSSSQPHRTARRPGHRRVPDEPHLVLNEGARAEHDSVSRDRNRRGQVLPRRRGKPRRRRAPVLPRVARGAAGHREAAHRRGLLPGGARRGGTRRAPRVS